MMKQRFHYLSSVLSRKAHRAAPAGFTLIELLVVMAIISILTAMLLPALGRVKQKAWGTACQSNMRQLVMAWMNYADDYQGNLPSNADGQDGMGIFTNWVAGTMSKPMDQTNTTLLTDPRQSSMATYNPSAKIYKCPADKSINVRSVAMNCRMNPTRIGGGEPAFTQGGNKVYKTFLKYDDIRYPTRIFVILDERSDSINDGFFGVDMSNTGELNGEGAVKPYWIVDYPATFHSQSANVSFADGHVEFHKWVQPTTLVPKGQARPGSWTCSDDKDIQWIQEHCTYRIQNE
jgi:prepilin-type N-terminal cleavage/methylation domain-containing protein/prepilin-type processing-associated H-X9-DG protein